MKIKGLTAIIVSLVICFTTAPIVNALDHDVNVHNAELHYKVHMAATKDRTVYCVPNAKVYHSTGSCRTLARSRSVYKTTLSKVSNRRACKVC